MLDQSLKDQLKTIFANLQSNFEFKIQGNSTHTAYNEMNELLNDVASCSENIKVSISNADELSFLIAKNGIDASVKFRAVPNGHEFTTLLMAILNLEGLGKNLPDEAATKKIKALKGKVKIKSYISLTCTNCPDVVQAINIFSFLNPSIQHEIIDGGINKEEVEKLNIQAVPSVYLNDELFHVGRSSLGELLTKLEEKLGSEFSAEKIEKNYDAVVVGGGPAGVSAAIYLARKGMNVAIAADHIGGQVSETVGIENLISVPSTTGSKLSGNLKVHLDEYPVDILENRKVTSVDLVEGMKHIHTSFNETLITPAMIIATGASWRRLNVPGENEHIGSGVAFCAHCDGPFYKGKKVAVIGGGNSGLEAAIDLSAIASEVTILEFLPEVKGDQVLQNKIKGINNIQLMTNVQTLSVEGDGSKVHGLKFKNRATDEEHILGIDGVFVQIGLKPNSPEFSHIVETTRFGEIVIDAHCRTNIPGIYAAGDVTTVPFKQIVIAMGEGAKAALSAFEDKIKDKLLG